MMSNIERRSPIDASKLDNANYINTLLGEGLRTHLAEIGDAHRFRDSMIDLLCIMCMRFTKGDSSSLPAEIASKLAESCLYQSGLALRACDTPEDALEKLKSKAARELYDEGHMICLRLHLDAKEHYRLVETYAPEAADTTYETTVRALKKYLLKYNADFFAAQLPAEIDYPLYIPVDGYTGIEYANEYLLRLSIENRFLSRFGGSELNELIRGCERDVSNIYEAALTNAIGCVICGRPARALTLEKSDISYLKKYFFGKTTDECMQMLESSYGVLSGELDFESGQAKAYFCSGAHEIAVRLSISPDGVFAMHRESASSVPENVLVIPRSLSDREFTLLYEEIAHCENAQEKAVLIASDVSSIYDFADIVAADCIEASEVSALL
ncbi:MAG TPA: DUF6179 domain-containing protein, partial [Bacillota bacterium]|nr:DUF6179 domain-containing protein [Bacillota bacterium]